MKSIVSVLLFFTLSFNMSAQCSTSNCSSNLGGDYTYIKTIYVDQTKLQPAPNQISYLFSKGSTYKILCCDQEIKGSRLVVNVYDRSKNLIATNKQKKKVVRYFSNMYLSIFFIRCGKIRSQLRFKI